MSDSAQPAHDAAAPDPAIDRRSFLGKAGAVAGLAALAGATSPTADAAPPVVRIPGQVTARGRILQAYHLRVQAAYQNVQTPAAVLTTNGDEAAYANKAGSYTKGLLHDAQGYVDPVSWQSFAAACSAGTQAAFENVMMGTPDPSMRFKLVNPIAGLDFDLEGLDVSQFFMPPPPALASAEEAAEAVELYWMSLIRDVHVSDWGTNPTVAAACAELTSLPAFAGPRQSGSVTPQTLFRDVLPGCTAGPYVSQFLLHGVPFGATWIDQKIRTVTADADYMTSFGNWLFTQNGFKTFTTPTFDATRRYLRNTRDLARWVQMDVLYQAYFHAALILSKPSDPGDALTGGGIACPLNVGNPYKTLSVQEGFGTFGPPYVMGILTEVATRALKAVWYHKWFVQRRLRPEEFGGRVHQNLAMGLSNPLHPSILGSSAVAQVFSKFGTYLLPQAFPEGSPLHPSYGSGHATVAGACVTVLKALFDCNFPYTSPKVASADGLTLVPYTGPDAGSLTVEGELNKLASNIATGRNNAGIHWRTDALEGIRLGEAVAISVLRDQRRTYGETFSGFTFKKFDGSTITV